MRVIRTKTWDGIVSYHPMSRATKISEMCERQAVLNKQTKEKIYTTAYEEIEISEEEAAKHGLVDIKAVNKAKDAEIEALKAKLAQFEAAKEQATPPEGKGKKSEKQ
jgi:hypothetical protein